MKKFIFAALVMLALTGCDGDDKYVKQHQGELLPPNAKVVEELGNCWKVVEIKADGKPRRFLWRYYWSSNATTEVLTELKE